MVNETAITQLLNKFLRNAEEMKQRYEALCAEWNDVELALVDIAHMIEIVHITEEGREQLYVKQQELLQERRQLKKAYAVLLPYMESVGEIITIKQEQTSEGSRLTNMYGIRSVRGYNLFSQLQPHISADSTQLFTDFTATANKINHIYKLHKEHPNQFKEVKTSLPKDPVPPKEVKIQTQEGLKDSNVRFLESPNQESARGYQSLADKEAKNEWFECLPSIEETEEQKKERLETQLRNTLRVGRSSSKRYR